MDRLPAVILAAAALLACDDKKEQPLPGRTDTTKVATKTVSTGALSAR